MQASESKFTFELHQFVPDPNRSLLFSWSGNLGFDVASGAFTSFVCPTQPFFQQRAHDHPGGLLFLSRFVIIFSCAYGATWRLIRLPPHVSKGVRIPFCDALRDCVPAVPIHQRSGRCRQTCATCRFPPRPVEASTTFGNKNTKVCVRIEENAANRLEGNSRALSWHGGARTASGEPRQMSQISR